MGEYDLIVVDDADCIVENEYTIDTLPLPEASFVIDSVVKVGELVEILNTSQSDVNWYWEFGDNSYSYDENPTAIYDTEGSYNVELTTYNTYGCSDTASTTVFAANDLLLFIPNTFTPNTDNKNESYKVSVLNTGFLKFLFIIVFLNFYSAQMMSIKDGMGLIKEEKFKMELM